MELTQRSFQLHLPLHLPLYNRIAESLSLSTTNNDGDDDVQVAETLLELYAIMKQSYPDSSDKKENEEKEEVDFMIGGPSFYHTPLCNLVHQNKIREAINFIKGLLHEHHNNNNNVFDYKTAVMLLSIMEARAIQDSKSKKKTMKDADAMELTVMLHEFVIGQNKNGSEDRMKERVKEAGEEKGDVSVRLLELILAGASTPSSLLEEDGDDDDDMFSDDDLDDEDYSNDDEDDDFARSISNKAIEETLRHGKILPTTTSTPNKSNIKPDASSSSSSFVIPSTLDNDNATSSSSSSPDIQILSGDDFTKFSLLHQVYTRDNTITTPSSSTSHLGFTQQFDLPDVSTQIVKINHGKEIKFTEEYEGYLVKQIMEEDEFDDDDDW